MPLEEILYFPEGTTLLFNKPTDSDEVIVSISGFENNIGAGLDTEEKVEAILDALQSDELDLRFQVSTSKLTDPDYVEDLLNSNILTTDILQLHNVNASFDMFLQDIDTGKPLEDTEPTKGHTGFKGINNNIAGDTIIHNGETYRLTNEGVYKGNEQIHIKKSIERKYYVEKIYHILSLCCTTLYESTDRHQLGSSNTDYKQFGRPYTFVAQCQQTRTEQLGQEQWLPLGWCGKNHDR